MQMFRKFLAAALVLTLGGLVVAGCATAPVRGPYAGPGDYGRANYSELGTIVSARDVMVRSDGRGGAVVGAVAGGAAGAALGGDTGGSIAGGLAGALLGGLLGSEIERSSSAREGIEYVIEMDSGRTVTVIQDPSRYFEPGSRVRVIFGDYVRVVPVYDEAPYREGPRSGPPPSEWQEDEGPYEDEGAYEEDGYR